MHASHPFAGKHVVIVHGYTASPAANWFPWLADTLVAAGARVDVPAMPAPLAPEPTAWTAALRAVAPIVDNDTFLVGHSLGCIAVLRHLLALPERTQAGGIVLVSGFERTLDTLPELSAFTDSPLDHLQVRRRAGHRASIFSDNDTIVAPAASRDLAVALDTTVAMVAGGGHFLDRDGFTQLPQVLETLERFATSPD
ncbi:alpha/beta fold hydrolase [Lysobacter sp. FW306-1B-D06B]|uniref:RBBP9/YdeN family alpha/beta hydrolase n=1 Tax=Lysobacter sp. FW306-1B-D06B TaxID=3140250 RepID=UPI0031409AEF